MTAPALPEGLGAPNAALSSLLRGASLALVLLRAGLALEPAALAAQPLRVGLLAAAPFAAEVWAQQALSLPLSRG